MHASDVRAEAIDHIEVRTFEAARRLGVRRPTDTEQAQYSLAFAVAAAAVHGDVSVGVLAVPTSADADVLRLSDSMTVTSTPDFDRAFPAQRLAEVTLALRDGRRLASGATTAAGSAEDPMSEQQLEAKYRDLAIPVLGAVRSAEIGAAIEGLRNDQSVDALCDALFAAP